jgi:trehalose 6-phosphate phosphatase
MPEGGADSLVGPAAIAREFASRALPGDRALIALDHDGTLSAIADSPDAAMLEPGAAAAIGRLGAVASVAIVSGRGLDDLAARFAGLPVTIMSEHGSRSRSPDGQTRVLATPIDAAVLDEVRARLATLLAGHGGWLVEDKGVSLAVHHRLVEEAALEPLLSEVEGILASAAAGPGASAVLQPGHAVLELRPRGAGKGAALDRLADELAAHPVLMVGDDLTDEPALETAEGRGGLGVLVSAAARDSAASARLASPAEVVALLEELADLLARN